METGLERGTSQSMRKVIIRTGRKAWSGAGAGVGVAGEWDSKYEGWDVQEVLTANIFLSSHHE